jgi:hypothetical protein
MHQGPRYALASHNQKVHVEHTLYFAPARFASSIDNRMRARLPSKSMAHWLRLHVATVASRLLMSARLCYTKEYGCYHGLCCAV